MLGIATVSEAKRSICSDAPIGPCGEWGKSSAAQSGRASGRARRFTREVRERRRGNQKSENFIGMNLTHQVLRQSLRVHTVIYRVSQWVLSFLSDWSTPFIRPDDALLKHG